ncbi:MAG: prolyl oligopeptidase family serine peptidase, partial [Armatimonadetes bacterium]|nr:prolyl oligopeptidase family serine peptidase [Armatimonadota bacterium]
YDEATPTPLLLGMHTWSSNYRQMVTDYGRLAVKHNWLLILPDFRGPNKASNPEPTRAGGSLYMQHDIIDAYHWMLEHYNVDVDRVYATGGSGGGHATLLIVSKYPDLFAAAAAWCPVSDFCDWWEVQNGYAKDVVAVTGGKPGENPAIDFEYLRRSPRTFITNLAHVPVLIGHGDRDGTIPVEQSWTTFRRLASVPQHKTWFYVFCGGHTSLPAMGLDWCRDFTRSHEAPLRLDLVTDESKSYYWADLRMADETRLATCRVSLEEDVLGIDCSNLSGLTLSLADLPLPDGSLSLAVRNEDRLTLSLRGLPEGARLQAQVEWATAEDDEGPVLTISPSGETRTLTIVW